MRCHYLLGKVDVAIEFRKQCHQQTRVKPEVYTGLALAYKANGDIEQAKNTMKQALLYAISWHDEFAKARCLELYDELHSA
jgi:Tfp pilus assembly protein PilF